MPPNTVVAGWKSTQTELTHLMWIDDALHDESRCATDFVAGGEYATGLAIDSNGELVGREAEVGKKEEPLGPEAISFMQPLPVLTV